jgi:hypothetical protein
MDPNTLVCHTIADRYSVETVFISYQYRGRQKNLYETTIYATQRETGGKLLNEMRKITSSRNQSMFNHFEFVNLASKPWTWSKKVINET